MQCKPKENELEKKKKLNMYYKMKTDEWKEKKKNMYNAQVETLVLWQSITFSLSPHISAMEQWHSLGIPPHHRAS